MHFLRRLRPAIAGVFVLTGAPHNATAQANLGRGGAAERVADPAPLFETYQAIFSLLFAGPLPPFGSERYISASERLIAVGLDKNAATALSRYVGESLTQQYFLTERGVSNLCKRKADITSKTQLGEAFADIYAQLDEMQETQWDGFEMLDDKNRKILSSYAAKRRLEIDIRPTNAVAVFEKSPESLPAAITRICKGKR